MTNEDKTSEWIKTEIGQIATLSNKINTIIVLYNLSRPNNEKYSCEYSISSAGNCITLSVRNSIDGSLVDKKELWLLDCIFGGDTILGSTLSRIKKNIREAKSVLRKMEKLAKKYTSSSPFIKTL
jgi:hypothetical protein